MEKLTTIRGRLTLLLTVLFLAIAALAFVVVDLQFRGPDPDPFASTSGTLLVLSGFDPVGFQIFLAPMPAEVAAAAAPAVDPALLLVGAWLALAPIFGWLAWRVAGGVTGRVGALTEAALVSGPANLAPRVNAGRHDELGRLAEAFNNLMDRFEHHELDRRRMVDDAVHEVRNPLAVMQTSLEIALADSANPPALRSAAEVSQRAGERISRTMDGLQATLRDRAPDTARASVDLRALVTEQVGDYQAVAARRGVAIQAFAPVGLIVMADRESVRRALANLVANAMRYAPAGSPIVIGAGATSGWRWLGVRDFGPGIAPEEQPLIFRRGWRGSSRSAGSEAGVPTDDGGSGIGLALVRQIAEAHGGAVRLSSAPRAGCSFVLWLPETAEERPSLETLADPLWFVAPPTRA